MRPNMNCEADDLISDELVFAGVQACPDLQAKCANGLADRQRASNRLLWRT
jgi:hypothetical protein